MYNNNRTQVCGLSFGMLGKSLARKFRVEYPMKIFSTPDHKCWFYSDIGFTTVIKSEYIIGLHMVLLLDGNSEHVAHV